MLTGIDPATPFAQLFAAYVDLRDRLRVRQRADHERGRVRDAAGPGGRRLGDRHDLPAVRPDARRGGRRGDRHLRRGRVGTADLSSASHPAWWTLTACGGVVLVLGFMATTGRAKRVGPADGGGAQSGGTRGLGWRRDERPTHRDATRGMAAHERPRARQPAAARGLRGTGHQLRPRPGGPPAGAPADVDGRARRGAGDRPCPTRPRSSTTSKPWDSCAGGRIPPTGGPRWSRRRARARRWPDEPTRSSPRRRRRSAR